MDEQRHGRGNTGDNPHFGDMDLRIGPEDLLALAPGSSAPAPPIIAGTVSGQTTTLEAPIAPFAHVTIVDANVGATDTLTITLGGVGGTLADGTGFTSLTTVSAGVYRLSGAAAAITSELEALIFTPTAGAPNTTSTTTFTLRDLSSADSTAAVDSTTTVIDSDPAITSSILWQNTSGQAAIWEMNGSTLLGGGPVSPSPGPAWRAVGTGDFNDDSHADILWQNASTGQASIWEMNGNTQIGGGAVTPNPRTPLACRRDRRFQSRQPFRHPVAEHRHRPDLGLGHERGRPDRRRGRQRQSGAGLASGRNGRFQSRRLFRHSAPEQEHGQVSIWEMDGTP